MNPQKTHKQAELLLNTIVFVVFTLLLCQLLDLRQSMSLSLILTTFFYIGFKIKTRLTELFNKLEEGQYSEENKISIKFDAPIYLLVIFALLTILATT